jgi:hypothetical protein
VIAPARPSATLNRPSTPRRVTSWRLWYANTPSVSPGPSGASSIPPSPAWSASATRTSARAPSRRLAASPSDSVWVS